MALTKELIEERKDQILKDIAMHEKEIFRLRCEYVRIFDLGKGLKTRPMKKIEKPT